MADVGLIAAANGGLLMDITGDPDTLAIAYANLTSKAVPFEGDGLVLLDSAASNAVKRSTITQIFENLSDTQQLISVSNGVELTFNDAGPDLSVTAGVLKAIINYSDSVGGTNADCFIDNAGLIAPNTSSREVKENIRDVADADVEKLLNLRPRKYQRIGQGPAEEIGLVAEEVYEIFPEACAMKSEEIEPEPVEMPNGKIRMRRRFRVTDKPQGVNSSSLVAPLLKLAQMQAATIAAMKERLDALEA